MKGFAGLAILGLELDRSVIDAKAFLDGVFQGVE
jgi:hypothetical protein